MCLVQAGVCGVKEGNRERVELGPISLAWRDGQSVQSAVLQLPTASSLPPRSRRRPFHHQPEMRGGTSVSPPVLDPQVVLVDEDARQLMVPDFSSRRYIHYPVGKGIVGTVTTTKEMLRLSEDNWWEGPSDRVDSVGVSVASMICGAARDCDTGKVIAVLMVRRTRRAFQPTCFALQGKAGWFEEQPGGTDEGSLEFVP